MNSPIVARCFELQYRIESRARTAVAAYRLRHAPLTKDYVEGLLIGGMIAAIGGVGTGFILWGPHP